MSQAAPTVPVHDAAGTLDTLSERAGAAGRVALSRVSAVAGIVRPLGWVVVALAASGWVVGAVLGWAEAMALATACAALLVVCAAFLVGRSVLHVEIDLRPGRVVVGERANGRLLVQSTATRRLLPVRVDLGVGSALARFDLPSLAPGSEHEELFQVSTERRGIVAIGPARAVRADPVGIFGRVVSQSAATQLFVHPKTIRVEGMGAGFLRDLEGRESTDLSPSDIAFHSLREYLPGDDRRHVHWKTSARTGVLMVQQFLDTRRSHVLVVLDDEAGHYGAPEHFETAVSVVGSIGVQAILDGQVRTVVAGDKVLQVATRGNLLDGLSGVEAVERAGGALRAAVVGSRTAPDASVVLIVTGEHATPTELRAAARRFGAGVRVAVVRVGPERSGFRVVDNLLLVEMQALPELPAVVNVVVNG